MELHHRHGHQVDGSQKTASLSRSVCQYESRSITSFSHIIVLKLHIKIGGLWIEKTDKDKFFRKIPFSGRNQLVVDYKATWTTVKLKFKKIQKKKKKIHSPPSFLRHIFVCSRGELSWARKSKKRNPPEKFFTFQEMELSSDKIKNFITFQKWYFLASYLCYISGGNFLRSNNQNKKKKKHSEKISYVLENGTS